MNTKSVYQWRPRTRFNIEAQIAGEELEKIKGHNSGDLTPEMVVQAASQATSPLHGLFEWNDAKAAHQNRLHVAGILIKSIVVTVAAAEKGEPTPVNVTVTKASGEGGTASARVVSEAELHAKRITKGWNDLDKWIASYGALPEFAQISAVIKALVPAKDKAA